MNRWNDIKKFTTISEENFKIILDLCIKESSFFIYNGCYYKQKIGLAIGSSLSPILAGFVLDDLFDNIFSIKKKPIFIKKYVDDILIADNENEVDKLFTELNKAHDLIKFTIEKEMNGEIPYLDLKLIHENGRILTDWYQKPYSSGRILNWMSNHPQNMKTNIGMSLINRILCLSDKKYHKKNIKIGIELLKANSFPDKIINKIVQTIKSKIKNQNLTSETKNTKFYSLPYVPVLSDQIKKDLEKNNSNIKLAFKPIKTLKDIFTNTKTKVKQIKSGYVYKINCLGDRNGKCNQIYVGESGREADNLKYKFIGPRTKEHKRDYFKAKTERDEEIKKREEVFKKFRTRNKKEELEKVKNYYTEIDNGKTFNTALVKHAILNNHEFDYNNVQILDYEENWKRRKMKESLYIYKNKEKCCNYKTDTQFLHNTVKQIIDIHNLVG